MATDFKIGQNSGTLDSGAVTDFVFEPPPRTTRLVRWVTFFAENTGKREPVEFRYVDTAKGQNNLLAHVEVDDNGEIQRPVLIALNRTTQKLTVQMSEFTVGEVHFHVVFADITD